MRIYGMKMITVRKGSSPNSKVIYIPDSWLNDCTGDTLLLRIGSGSSNRSRYCFNVRPIKLKTYGYRIVLDRYSPFEYGDKVFVILSDDFVKKNVDTEHSEEDGREQIQDGTEEMAQGE